MLYFSQVSRDHSIDAQQTGGLLDAMLSQLGRMRRVLLIPPDFTRLHSGAGEIASLLYQRLHGTCHVEALPALGTHRPMPPEEIATMFPGIPVGRFREHDWRDGVASLGRIDREFVRDTTGGSYAEPIHCEVNRLLLDGDWDRIICVGQAVPHEVVGIAGHCKSIFVGTGGADAIHKTHFIGALCGMERIMGRADTPPRRILNHMATEFGKDLPISYVLTVRERDTVSGAMATRGLFGGDDTECFEASGDLCRQVNIHQLDAPLRKVVVYLDPAEYKSTWLGNKAIYRTRMAIADGGELLILAPGVERFGEDAGMDALIRKYGYRGTPYVLDCVAGERDFASNLAAAAHLIHGSSEGRFRVVYAAGAMAKPEVEGAGYEAADLSQMLRRYDPRRMREGTNRMADGEKVFYISDPATGLWALKSTFERP